jgi:tetrahydromethanopterin S-methyltransferase subunit G
MPLLEEAVVVEGLDAMVDYVLRARLVLRSWPQVFVCFFFFFYRQQTVVQQQGKAVSAIEEAVAGIQRQKDDIEELAAHLKAQLERKVHDCLSSLDSLMGEHRGRMNELADAQQEARNELERKVDQWNEALDCTVAGISARLGRKVRQKPVLWIIFYILIFDVFYDGK